MRPYRNISDSELEALGAVREWSKEYLLSLTLPSKILWVHASRERFHRLEAHNSCLIRLITVYKIEGDIVKTNFGSYSLHTGKNLFSPYGNKRSCNCHGQLYLLRNSIRH